MNINSYINSTKKLFETYFQPLMGMVSSGLKKQINHSTNTLATDILKKTEYQIPDLAPSNDLIMITPSKKQDTPNAAVSKPTEASISTFSQPQTLVQKSYQIPTTHQPKAFHNYLLSDHQLLPQNKILLENTVCQSDISNTSLTYHIFTPHQSSLETILNAPLKMSSSIELSCIPEWYDYTQSNDFFIDFAHATSFGGAYRSYGCVQEERMFCEFPSLALLDYKTQNGVHPCVDSYTNGGHRHYPPFAKPAPFIVESVHREFDISRTPYGGRFQTASEETILQGIVKVQSPVPVNIIGLAAVDWRGCRNPNYRLNDLTYHFEAAYLANIGAKQLSTQKGWGSTNVHTAPWGCGAFLNSDKMMTAIQYLAAQTAGINKLTLHGVGNPMNPDYNQQNIDDIVLYVSLLIQDGKSPKEILQDLLQLSYKDNSWAPKS